MNLLHAERWEGQFPTWSISERVISLDSIDKGYFVRLSDGMADFRCESAEAFSRAVGQANEVTTALVKDQHRRATTSMETQFLVPWKSSFEDLVSLLDAKLLKPDIVNILNADVIDTSYLVDTQIGGVFYQINIGPVRKQEITRRITAKTLVERPDISIFVSIATRKPFEHGVDDLATYVDRTIDVGNTVIRELQA